MIGERFSGVLEVPASGDRWPSHFLMTDIGIYEFTWRSFVKFSERPRGASLQFPEAHIGLEILDVRGDGESAAVLLEGGNIVVFESVHDPFGPTIVTFPRVRWARASEAQEWDDEFAGMPRMSVTPGPHGV